MNNPQVHRVSYRAGGGSGGHVRTRRGDRATPLRRWWRETHPGLRASSSAVPKGVPPPSDACLVALSQEWLQHIMEPWPRLGCRNSRPRSSVGHQMSRSPLLPLLFLACSSATPPERYGFVTTLGNDTVSVERIERSPTRLVSDGVDRWPFVRQRHTEFDLAPDGKIRHMLMDIRTPNGRSLRERGRRVTADFSRDQVKISVRDSVGVRDTAFGTGGAITVSHASMMYSVIELEIAAALRQAAAAGLASGDSVLFRQFYPDRDVGPSFTMHRGFVHPKGGGKVELRHDWLAGTGDVTVDSGGRMLTYSGMRSTYKVAVARTTAGLDIGKIGDRFASEEQRTGP